MKWQFPIHTLELFRYLFKKGKPLTLKMPQWWVLGKGLTYYSSSVSNITIHLQEIDITTLTNLDCLQSQHTLAVSTLVAVGLRLDSPNFKLGILDFKKIKICLLSHCLISIQQPPMCWLWNCDCRQSKSNSNSWNPNQQKLQPIHHDSSYFLLLIKLNNKERK